MESGKGERGGGEGDGVGGEWRGGRRRRLGVYDNHFISLCQCFEVAQKMNNELLESVKEMTLVGLVACVVSKVSFCLENELI